jgi:antitoxin (DNA-binding transcriptional repressor) of toxin-antitoxin stability system
MGRILARARGSRNEERAQRSNCACSARVLAWLQAGEEVALTLRRQAVATLIPCSPKKRAKRPMPDLGARLQKVFGRRVIPDRTMKAIMNQDRGVF